MIKLYKKYFFTFFLIVVLYNNSSAQFTGGNGAGSNFLLATNQPLGRNIFKGGNDDGTGFALAGNTALGRNIFTGGNDDGTVVGLASNAALGRNIFKGGNDDGTNVGLAGNSVLGRNIFTGGNDDGTSFGAVSNTTLGRNIFAGGINDGWAMAMVSNTPLPITLVNFNGIWRQNDAFLTWQTATEINSAYFELERSFNGTAFTTIQHITAAGQSTGILNYQYLDANIKEKIAADVTTLYYRLRSVDKNGAATYSGVVLLNAIRTGNISYSVYPNPAKSFITISCSQVPVVNNSYIRIADASGKVVILQKMTGASQQLSVSNLSDGVYFLQVITENKIIYTQKVIIHK